MPQKRSNLWGPFLIQLTFNSKILLTFFIFQNLIKVYCDKTEKECFLKRNVYVYRRQEGTMPLNVNELKFLHILSSTLSTLSFIKFWFFNLLAGFETKLDFGAKKIQLSCTFCWSESFLLAAWKRSSVSTQLWVTFLRGRVMALTGESVNALESWNRVPRFLILHSSPRTLQQPPIITSRRTSVFDNYVNKSVLQRTV